jgi:hypothetical protein
MSIFQSIHRGCVAIGLAAAVAFIAGCDEIDQMNEKANQRPPVMMPPQVVDAPGNQKDAANTTPTNAAPATDPNAAPATPANGTTMERATAGVGKQGQGYGGDIITQPVHVFFTARDTITFDIQLKHQLDLWKAMHNNKPPKNKDEYMKEIVEPCGVELPELPPGHRYVYDAKAGELMVESGGPAQ